MEAGAVEAGLPQVELDPNETCAVIGSEPIPAGSLRRLLVGKDDLDRGPQEMSTEELERELNDPFATELLRKGRFPASGEEVLEALNEAVGSNHPLSEATQQSFLVGEGTQIAKDPSEEFDRNFRFVVTRGQGPDGPDFFLSVGKPGEVHAQVEVLAWDQNRGGFNFYRSGRGSESRQGAWIWAGNSRHAFDPDLRGKGPFESHPSGNILMKELKIPWVHWASPKAPVDERDFQAGDGRATHPWFKNQNGAYALEDAVRPSINRWNRRRLEEINEAGTIDPIPLLEQILGSRNNRRHTVNLVSSPDSSASAVNAESLRLPETFFVDADAIAALAAPNFQLARPPAFTAPGALYKQALQKFEVAVREHDQGEVRFERAGDLHFAWVVPERAFEDVNLIAQLVSHPQVNLITRRLVVCLLMVDFPNPVFSTARADLLRHVPTEPVPAERWATFSQELGDKVAAAGAEASEDAAERQFAELWQVGEEGLVQAANALLEPYFQKVSEQLQTEEGFDAYFRLAETRRTQVRGMRIKESPLLFAETNLEDEELAMARDGSVVERPGG